MLSRIRSWQFICIGIDNEDTLETSTIYSDGMELAASIRF